MLSDSNTNILRDSMTHILRDSETQRHWDSDKPRPRDSDTLRYRDLETLIFRGSETKRLMNLTTQRFLDPKTQTFINSGIQRLKHLKTLGATYSEIQRFRDSEIQIIEAKIQWLSDWGTERLKDTGVYELSNWLKDSYILRVTEI